MNKGEELKDLGSSDNIYLLPTHMYWLCDLQQITHRPQASQQSYGTKTCHSKVQ